MRCLFAGLIAGAVLSSAVAGAETVNDRLRAVEKKTDFYKVSRLTKVKKWAHLRSRTRAEDFEARAYFDVPSGENDPLLTNIWVRLQANYSHPSGSNFIVAHVSVLGVPEGSGEVPDSQTTLCLQQYFWRGTSGTVDTTFVCHGVLNAQNSDVLRVVLSLSAAGPASVDGVVVTAHMVNEVLIEPPP